ncbi:hypothetical protein Tco_0978077, partial [Tanacetum coccineum]
MASVSLSTLGNLRRSKQEVQGIQDKYVTKILKKFGFSDVKTASTPMETHKPLLKDADGEDVDEHLYRSMIGSLMYLTSSRPDIMFAVCACARFQVNPKSSHLHAVKRIFRYLKGQPKLGLWYPKDSPFDLVAYTDSDYAGASLDRKSTTGGCQFLGCRLISWQCKKHTMTKIHIDNESNICIVKNPVFHSKTKHIQIRHHFIRDSNEKILIQMIKIHTDQNVADLLTKAFDVSRFEYVIATKVKIVNGEVQIQALVDKKRVIITETSIRSDLQLEDAKGTECLPNATIFEQLTLMGAKTTAWNEFSRTMASTVIWWGQISNVSKGKDFSGRDTPLFQTMMGQAQEEGEGFVMPIVPQHTPTINQPSSSQPQKKQKPRKSKKQNTKVSQPSDSIEPIADEAPNDENVPTYSNDPLLSVLDLENTKTSQAAEITKLKKRVKKLERRNKSRTQGLKRLRKVGRTARIESSEDKGLGDQEDASKQGRKITDIDADKEEVEVEKVVSIAEVTTASATTTLVEELTLAQTLIEIKAAKPKAVTTAATTTTTVVTRPKARGAVVQEPSEFTTTISPSQPSQLLQAKDKGNAKMVELEIPLKKKDQILIDEEIAQKLQEELQAELEKEERLRRQKEEDANIIEWDNIQAMMDADYELTARLQAQDETRTEGSSKRVGEELDESENIKKQKLDENVEAEVDDDVEMKKHMEIVPDDEVAIDATPLSTKPPIIVDWKNIKEGNMVYFYIIRADGSSRRPKEAYERVLWGDLKVMFERDVESKVNEARGAKDTLGILFWGVMHKRFGVITSWDFCYDLKSLLSNVEQFKPLRFGADEELSDGGPLRVIIYGYDGIPMQPVAPPSLDYVPGPEHPSSPNYVPGPKHPPSLVEVPYVLELEYPEYLAPSNDEAPLEDQPLSIDASPTALSPGYVTDSDLDKDLEEDPEEDHADYLADRGDDDDEPSDDDDDDDTDNEDEEPFEDEDDDEEEEEHLALADSSTVPVVDPVPSAGDTEAFETDESAPTPRS